MSSGAVNMPHFV